MNTTPAHLTVRQAAAELGITPRAILHRIAAGTLPATKLGDGTSAYIITREDLEAAKAADLFGDEPLRLPRDARIPMSNMLAEKGMSNRAIGAVLGVDEGTVRNDRQTGAELSAPASPRARGNRGSDEVVSDLPPEHPHARAGTGGLGSGEKLLLT